MTYSEIDKIMARLCSEAVKFHKKTSKNVEDIAYALEEGDETISQEDFDAINAAIGAYADGLKTLMDGMLTYIHRRSL